MFIEEYYGTQQYLQIRKYKLYFYNSTGDYDLDK